MGAPALLFLQLAHLATPCLLARPDEASAQSVSFLQSCLLRRKPAPSAVQVGGADAMNRRLDDAWVFDLEA